MIDPAEFLHTLYNDGWKIIYLRRKDKVKHALSKFVADYRKGYHKFDDNKEHLSLSIDCGDFIDSVAARFTFEKIERDALAKVSYHQVIYEDDLEKNDMHQATVNKILDYTLLKNCKIPPTKYHKVNTQSLKDLIANYDELADALKKKKWVGNSDGIRDFLQL